MTEQQIKTSLARLGVEVTGHEPFSDEADASIQLGGKYDGIHIQVGDGYYSVVRERPSGRFLFIDGMGHLKTELQKALNTP